MPGSFTQRKGHSTGMAGEFCVMEKLFRLGYEASLTMGNAKSIDVLAKSPTGQLYEISVKSIRGGGKWGIGKEDVSKRKNLVYVLLYYRDFSSIETQPAVWVIPAADAQKIKEPWFENFAIYCSNKKRRTKLEKYKDAWTDYLK